MNAGHIDRDWASVLLAIAREARSGELVVQHDHGELRLAFAAGRIANATSTLPADSALRIARLVHSVSSAQEPGVAGRLAADPTGDPIAIIAECAKLSPTATLALRRHAIARCAARSFDLDGATWTFSPQAMLSFGSKDLDVRAVIFLGARLYLTEDRLHIPEGQYRLREPVVDGFELRELEHKVVAQLAAGTSVAEAFVLHRGVEPHTLQALFYALAVAGAIELAVARRATGTMGVPPLPRTYTPGSLQLPRARTTSVKIPAIVVALAKEAANASDD